MGLGLDIDDTVLIARISQSCARCSAMQFAKVLTCRLLYPLCIVILKPSLSTMTPFCEVVHPFGVGQTDST